MLRLVTLQGCIAPGSNVWCNTPMPNQPKTPARTFRLSDDTIQKVDDMSTTMGTANRSETIRGAVESMHNFMTAMQQGTPSGISLEAIVAAQGAIEAETGLEVSDDAVAAAFVAAKPFLLNDVAHAERQRTLRDVIVRLEGMQVDQYAIDHLKSLLD